MQGARFMPDPSWSVLESEDGKRFTIDCDGGPMLPRKVIATVYNSRRVDGKANARLIAASPTMYEYLARRSASGDDEASTILESIHGRTQGNGSVERRQG